MADENDFWITFHIFGQKQRFNRSTSIGGEHEDHYHLTLDSKVTG